MASWSCSTSCVVNTSVSTSWELAHGTIWKRGRASSRSPDSSRLAYEVELVTLTRDLASFVGDLERAGLIGAKA